MTYITQEMYRSLGGGALDLAKNEIAVSPFNIKDMGFDCTELTIDGYTYRVKTVLPVFPVQPGIDVAGCL